MQKRLLAATLAAGFLFACDNGTPDAETEPGALPEPAAEASAELDLFAEQPTAGAQIVFVAEARPGQADEYPGAVFVPLSAFSVERDGIPNEFPHADSMAAQLQAAGLRGERFLIVGEPIPAGRAWAALDYLGLGERAALLDGGPSALGQTAGTADRANPPATPETGAEDAALEVDVRDDMIVDAEWVHERLDDPNVVILDARPPAQFSGETPGEGINRPGHIPGARNLFWQDLVQSESQPRLKDEAELRRLFEQAGATPGKTVVAYCRTGGQGSFLYTVARHLGYDVKLYDGSYVDWSRTDYPVER